MENQLKPEEIQRLIKEEVQKIFGQYQAVPKSIKQRHLEGNILFFGTAANRPDGSTEVKAWFSTDTGVLNLWDGDSWVQIT